MDAVSVSRMRQPEAPSLPVSRTATLDDKNTPGEVEEKTTVASQRSTFRSVCIVAACTSSMMMNTASQSPAIILPSVGRDLNIEQANLQWVISAYAISSGCCLLVAGRLADLYGRKRVWLIGYLILAAFGLGCGFAQSAITLDVLRGLQGLGGAAVIPASLGILAQSFPPSRARSIAFATFASGAPLGGAVSFIVGGVVTQLTRPEWRSLFYVITGVCAAGMALGAYCIDADQPNTEDDKRVDWIGAFLITAGLVLVVFVLSDSPIASRGWKTNYIIALFVVGVCLVLAFLAWQYYLERRQLDPNKPRTIWTAPPLMKLSMWGRARGRFAVMQFIACLNWAAFTCWLVWVQLYYQDFLGLTPILTMVRVLPITFVGIAANVAIALLVGRLDVMYIIALGTTLTGVADLLFAVIKPELPYWAFGFPSAMIIVLGADFVFAPGTLFISKISLPHEQSVAGAVFQSMTQIGTALGLSISTIVYNGVLESKSRALGVPHINDEGTNAPRQAQLKAYQAAYWTGFAFAIFCTSLSVLLRGVGIVGHRKTDVEKSSKTLTTDEPSHGENPPS